MLYRSVKYGVLILAERKRPGVPSLQIHDPFSGPRRMMHKLVPRNHHCKPMNQNSERQMLEQCCAKPGWQIIVHWKLFCYVPIGWPYVGPRQNYARHSVNANPICNPKRDAGTLGKRGRKKTATSLLGLQIGLALAAQSPMAYGHFAPPDKSGSMLHVPAESLNHVASRSCRWSICHFCGR